MVGAGDGTARPGWSVVARSVGTTVVRRKLLMLVPGLPGACIPCVAGVGDATAVTAGNFVRAVPMALALSLLAGPVLSVDVEGAWYAVDTRARWPQCRHALWYRALPGLRPVSAATVQPNVPVIAALGGVVLRRGAGCSDWCWPHWRSLAGSVWSWHVSQSPAGAAE